jgi:hypothetical protein
VIPTDTKANLRRDGVNGSIIPIAAARRYYAVELAIKHSWPRVCQAIANRSILSAVKLWSTLSALEVVTLKIVLRTFSITPRYNARDRDAE